MTGFFRFVRKKHRGFGYLISFESLPYLSRVYRKTINFIERLNFRDSALSFEILPYRLIVATFESHAKLSSKNYRSTVATFERKLSFDPSNFRARAQTFEQAVGGLGPRLQNA
jgi:hypothetical protein